MKKKTPPPGYGTNTPGRRRLFGEPTKTVAFRIPESHIAPVKQIINNYLDQIRVDKTYNT